MRYLLIILAMAALSCGLASYGIAEETNATKAPDPNKTESRSETAAKPDLRVEIHRTLAILIEARSAEKPDQAKVEELAQKLQRLRGELRAQTTASGSVANGWTCPMGGPGMGYGRGGWGMGRGPGGGFGPGAGRGWGGGAGAGRGLGPGAGQGLAPGGPAFVDQDNDGVCDYYELRHGLHK